MLQRTGVRCIWLTKTKEKERKKMTPDDIATSLSGLKPVGEGNINLPSWSSTLGGKDWNQWDS